MCMTSKTWRRAARPKMYGTIWLVGDDSILHVKKKFKMKWGSRLKLLRRTLRENRILAECVRELKVPDVLGHIAPKGSDRERYVDVVASVVMACPNLERLTGFYNKYDHNFDRLSYALSTRTRLKEHVWVIAGDNSKREASSSYLSPGLLQPEQADTFLHLHDVWRRLETLFVHSQSAGVLDHELFIGAFMRLPSLKHLSISNFDAMDFDDTTLGALPPLESLRLQNLHGITDRGMLHYASSTAAQPLRHLSLINLEIMGLAVISKLFASLHDLRRFTFVQESSPESPIGGIVFQPIVASASLAFLHWDVLVPGSANDNLAASIEAGGFPKLRTLRAPSDHHGALQAVCRPLESVTISSDKYSFAARRAVAAGNETRYLRTLFAARQAAQARIERARTQARFKIVIEEAGVVKQVLKIPGFVGAIGSNVSYSLTPDVHGSDSAVIDVPDLLDGGKETDARDGCTGVWNSEHPGGKKWWSHKERFRYRRVELGRFF
ncbi:MAG: hypothetical protein M1832_003376 [Thelocarpon impressellum]|nr:MAG: hypothetical protein M1832_003376 [Thelocarpon impressellum]